MLQAFNMDLFILSGADLVFVEFEFVVGIRSRLFKRSCLRFGGGGNKLMIFLFYLSLLIWILYCCAVDVATDPWQFLVALLGAPLDWLIEILIQFLRPLHHAEKLQVLVSLVDAAGDHHRSVVGVVAGVGWRRLPARHAAARGAAGVRAAAARAADAASGRGADARSVGGRAGADEPNRRRRPSPHPEGDEPPRPRMSRPPRFQRRLRVRHSPT